MKVMFLNYISTVHFRKYLCSENQLEITTGNKIHCLKKLLNVPEYYLNCNVHFSYVNI